MGKMAFENLGLYFVINVLVREDLVDLEMTQVRDTLLDSLKLEFPSFAANFMDS